MSNHLKGQTSPYLLQHAENPVDWYPWCEEAFRRAREEDRPVFLSIGYSTCHWCHVMARESFEDPEIAGILNRFFVPVKVDREERPDIDSIYMAACQAFTGSGGWPASIFMTGEQKPFFAGTYFPPTSRHGRMGFRELLLAVRDRWEDDRASLLRSAEEVTALLGSEAPAGSGGGEALAGRAMEWYRRNFDGAFGGFGPAPKFPAPHVLLFLMQEYEKHGDRDALRMAETTLRQMYAGGLFDHIGYGFCRYSTDRRYLVPHFEKMLCDNAMLILAYCRAHELTGRRLYLSVAEKTAAYVLEEMTSPEGGFYSAQDADSEGVEGRYYVFTPEEIVRVLGPEAGPEFCRRYDITGAGNFEGRSIPNLLGAENLEDDRFAGQLGALREYRRRRCRLHTDDKILTGWNSLMIAALCLLYRRSGNAAWLEAARRASSFMEAHLCEGNALYVSFRGGRRGGAGFLDDYACYIFALLSMYEATLERTFLERAAALTGEAEARYYDRGRGGFFLSGGENEKLIFRPKESYDGALPSGNSLMAWNLVRLNCLCPEAGLEALAGEQLDYLSGEAGRYPPGFSMFLTALSDFCEPPLLITVVRADGGVEQLPLLLPSSAAVRVLDVPLESYRLLDGETTFYVCRAHACLPPMKKRQFMELLEKEKLRPAD